MAEPDQITASLTPIEAAVRQLGRDELEILEMIRAENRANYGHSPTSEAYLTAILSGEQPQAPLGESYEPHDMAIAAILDHAQKGTLLKEIYRINLDTGLSKHEMENGSTPFAPEVVYSATVAVMTELYDMKPGTFEALRDIPDTLNSHRIFDGHVTDATIGAEHELAINEAFDALAKIGVAPEIDRGMMHQIVEHTMRAAANSPKVAQR